MEGFEAASDATPDVSSADDFESSSHVHDPSENSTSEPKKKEAPDPLRSVKHKLKVDGREEELDYDDLVKEAQKGRASDKRFREAAEKERAVQERLKRLAQEDLDNDDEIFEVLGAKKAMNFARKIREHQEYYDSLTDQERDLLHERQARESYERQLEEIRQKEEQAQRQQREQKAVATVNREISEALMDAKNMGVPLADLPEVVEGICDEMLAYLDYMDAQEKAGLPITKAPPSAKDVVNKMHGRYRERANLFVGKLPAKDLIKLLSKEQLDGLRQMQVDELYQGSTPPASRNSAQTTDQKPIKPEVEGRRSTDSWFKSMDKRMGIKK